MNISMFIIKSLIRVKKMATYRKGRRLAIV